MLKALEEIQSMPEEKFKAGKAKVLEQINEFSIDLQNVSQKYYLNLEEQIMEEDDQSNDSISETITQSSLYFFVKEWLINKSRRITIELFAKKISETEQQFKLPSEQNLDKRGYDIVTFEEMIKRKSETNHKFK